MYNLNNVNFGRSSVWLVFFLGAFAETTAGRPRHSRYFIIETENRLSNTAWWRRRESNPRQNVQP